MTFVVNAIVVYWLAHSPLERKVDCSNPVWVWVPATTCGKSCESLTISLHLFEISHWIGKVGEVKPQIVQWSLLEDKCWVLCADGIRLQSLGSVRFLTSIVRNCLKYPSMSNRTHGYGILEIDLASSRSQSRHLYVPLVKNQKLFFPRYLLQTLNRILLRLLLIL